MARTIKTEPGDSDKSLESTERADGYTARLIKYIPGETIVFFVSADRIIQGYLPQILQENESKTAGTVAEAAASSPLGMWLSLGLLIFCLILTPFSSPR